MLADGIFPHFFGFFSVPTLPSVGHSAKALPSARQKTLDKDAFADGFFVELSLPSTNWALPSAPGRCVYIYIYLPIK